jgi:hypothetical protein
MSLRYGLAGLLTALPLLAAAQPAAERLRVVFPEGEMRVTERYLRFDLAR